LDETLCPDIGTMSRSAEDSSLAVAASFAQLAGL